MCFCNKKRFEKWFNKKVTKSVTWQCAHIRRLLPSQKSCIPGCVSSVNPCTSLVRWPRLVGLRLLPKRRQLGSPAARIVSLPRLLRWPHASNSSSSVVSRKRFVTAFPLFVEVVVITAVLPSTPTCHLLQLSSSGSSWKCPLVKETGPTRSATSLIFHGSHHTLRGTIR